jgi:integrase
MATITQRGSAWQLRVRHRLLPRVFYHSFDTEIEARNYGEQLESLLARGIVPAELLARPATQDDPLLTQVLSAYSAVPSVSPSDDALLGVMMRDKPVIGLRLSGVTYRWAESYVAWLKSAEINLAPGSIRKRIGAMGRALDWRIRSTTGDGATPMANVLRLLPRGYSTYSKVDTGTPRRDVQRDRRLSPEEGERIDAALTGVKRPDRERIYTDDPAFVLLYRVIVDTGLRLFEAFRLRVDSIDLAKNIILVDGSKGHRGYVKPRVVPIKPALREPLRSWCAGRVGLLFPYWDGSPESRQATSSRLSRRFGNLFDYAQVPDFTEHDLRHEAACRWFELRDSSGRWVFSDIEVARIMGWADLRMALRYASLRGEDLAARLG